MEESINKLPEILGAKYKLKCQLANKGGRKTLLASNLDNQELVVIKLLTFGNDISWEDLKLFEREAETLKSIFHPAIPSYVDYFEINTNHNKGFALVQTYIDAPSLEEQLQAGRSFSEIEVKQLAKAILSILDYLHSLQPAIIHRDIKPSNILLTNRSGDSIGDVYLVDFGSVQNLATKKGSTITVVGTYGYMPPEQFGGRAKPASDLYSLGATLIYVVTGQHPADLPEKDRRIAFEHLVNISPGLTNWLNQLTEPSLSNRLKTVKEAVYNLENCDCQNKSNTQKIKPIKVYKPNNSKIILNKNSQVFKIIIPPTGLFSEITLLNLFLLVCFISLGLGISALKPESYDYVPQYAVTLSQLVLHSADFALLIGIVTFLSKTLLGIFGRMQLQISTQKISLTYTLPGIKRHSPLPSLRKDIFRIEKFAIEKENYSHFIIYSANKKYEIFTNSHFPVTSQEIDWLTYEVSNWLNIPFTEIKCFYDPQLEIFNFYLEQFLSRLDKNNYQGLIEDCDRVIQSYPDFQSAYFYRGVANINLENYHIAIQDCDYAIQLNPQLAETYINKAFAYEKLENHQEALKNCDLALTLEPNSFSAYHIKGMIYTGLEDYQSAIKNYDIAIQLEPNFDEAHLNQGLAYFYLNDYQNAIKKFNFATDINPKYVTAYHLKGIGYLSLEDYQNAIEIYDCVIKLNPNFVEAYLNKGLAYLNLKDYQSAIENCDMAIGLNPKLAEAYYNKTVAYFNLGDYQSVIENCDRAIELNPKLAEAYCNRGNILSYLGKTTEALEDFTKYIELSASANAYYNLAITQNFLNMQPEAMHNLDSCLQADPQHKFAYYYRANINYDFGQREEGLEDFKKAIKLEEKAENILHKDDEHGYYAKGLAKWRFNKDIEGAIQDLEIAAAISKKHQYKEFEKKVIVTLQEIKK
ncbi:MAG: hypothetical protein Tsb0014_08900 [Pleurocapsa sp.]